MSKTFPHFWGIKTFLKWILLIHLGLLSTLTHAVEIQPRDSLHSGVVKEGDFTIFPQNRLGNGLYRNGTLMASEADQQIIGSQPIRRHRKYCLHLPGCERAGRSWIGQWDQ